MAEQVVPAPAILLEYAPGGPEVFSDPRNPLFNPREQLVPDPAPQLALVRIAGILPRCQSSGGQIRPNLVPGDVEERTDPSAAVAADPGQSRRAGSVEKPHDHGFDLVVTVMTGHDEGGAVLLGNLLEPGDAGAPGNSLGCPGAEFDSMSPKWESVAGCGRGNPIGDVGALGMNPVIEVGDEGGQAETFADRRDQVEQGNRVRSA